jgi:hypothetical protein
LTRVEQIIAAADSLGDLQLITSRENLAKNAGDAARWLDERDEDYLNLHLVPRNRELWDVRTLPEFVAAREKLIRSRLYELSGEPRSPAVLEQDSSDLGGYSSRATPA